MNSKNMYLYYIKESQIPKNELELMALAQHYGLITRLLDWTKNPLVALWFSVAKKNNTKDSIVWTLEIDDKKMISNPKIDIKDIGKTMIYQPKQIDKRILSQSGWFTVHKYLNKGSFVKLENNISYRKILKKIIIPKDFQERILVSLNDLNINSRTIFPYMEGLTNHINWEYTKFYSIE